MLKQFCLVACPPGRYQSRSNGGWAAPAGASGYGGDDDKHSAFTDIVHQFIKNGAPNEVNLRYVLRTVNQSTERSLMLHVSL